VAAVVSVAVAVSGRVAAVATAAEAAAVTEAGAKKFFPRGPVGARFPPGPFLRPIRHLT
jgi:hypothetical protein